MVFTSDHPYFESIHVRIVYEWPEFKTLLQKITSTRECSNATTSHHLVLTLSLTFAIQGHSCEGSTSTLNWNLALAESVIPHSGWMSRTKEWLSTSGGVKPSTASVKMESPCRKWGQDMYTGFPACPSRFRYQIICKYKQKFIQTWCK